MLTIIGHHLRRFRRDRRGVSNIIVVALSLVIIAMVVSNIILWSYQMNQVDWEKQKENLKIINVAHATSSPWFTAESEYSINKGALLSGTYVDSHAMDDSFEAFRESSGSNELDLKTTFLVDLSCYPLSSLTGLDIQLRYRASDSGEKWFLKAYNWVSADYSDDGFNLTTGHRPTTGWNTYAVNVATQWWNYVHGNGTIYVKLVDQRADASQTAIDVDFLGLRAQFDGAQFSLKNEGSSSAHLVSLWIINSTFHRRYDVDVIVNSGETYNYIRADVALPSNTYSVKIVTEKGNTAVYSG